MHKICFDDILYYVCEALIYVIAIAVLIIVIPAVALCGAMYGLAILAGDYEFADYCEEVVTACTNCMRSYVEKDEAV